MTIPAGVPITLCHLFETHEIVCSPTPFADDPDYQEHRLTLNQAFEIGLLYIDRTTLQFVMTRPHADPWSSWAFALVKKGAGQRTPKLKKPSPTVQPVEILDEGEPPARDWRAMMADEHRLRGKRRQWDAETSNS